MIRKTTERKRRWASLAKAAEYFDCSVWTMRHYISEGVVPGHHVHGKRTIKVDLNELDDLMERIPSAKSRRAS